MSRITTQNPIRYTVDTLTQILTGVIASNAASSINLTGASRVNAISVGGSQPSASARYFAFRIGTQWGKLTSSGNFQAFASNTTDFANIEANGNTPEELALLNNIPALAGQNIGLAIALSTTDPDNALPTCSVTFSCITDTQQLTSIQYSPVYNLGAGSQIISLNADTASALGGSVSLTAQATLDDGTLTDWKNIDTFAGQKCKSVQFKGEYKSVNVGISSAQINSASVIYSDGSSLSTGLTDGEIITQTMDWYMPIHSCRLTVNHAPLENSEITAYVAFREQPIQVRGETLGIGSGSRKTFQLQHIAGLKYDSFVLYFDNVRVFTDYELNTEVGRVTCIAPEGVIVSCDYAYGWDTEQWQQMRLTSRISMDGYDRSEYRFSQESNSKSMAAIKLKLSTTSGSITGEVLGTGTGTARSYKLTKRILDGKITLYVNGQTVNSKNWTLLDDPQYISAAVPAGQTLRANYEWLSEQPVIYQFAAVFAE